ncbi:MAG TPA: nucleotidyltransferase domain-containing protein [Tepidisphaeraceae bacterium]|jgi:predicted nucleotidyltransferase|nr:nucleotidyltransferase domain-containing protein [Tepidisphaeraceae bacterium]
MDTVAENDAGSVLFGSTRRALLGLLLERPAERFHMRQLARLTAAGLGPVQRELAALTGAGILLREQSGRQVYFQANQTSPLFTDLRSLIRKTSGAPAVVRQALLPLQTRIQFAVLFGSMASGLAHSESDVDILVISDDLSFRELAGAIRQTSKQLGRDVGINLYKPAEWQKRIAEGHPLARSILNNPHVVLLGDRDELERMAEKRVGKAARRNTTGNRATIRRHRARSESQRK